MVILLYRGLYSPFSKETDDMRGIYINRQPKIDLGLNGDKSDSDVIILVLSSNAGTICAKNLVISTCSPYALRVQPVLRT